MKINRKGLIAKILTIGLATAPLISSAQQNSLADSLLELSSCHVPNISRQVQCGTLEVPENYQKPNAEQLSLNIVVIPAIDASNEKEPVMYLAGGPGQAATSIAAMVQRSHFETHKTRDIILVDQRGTGDSSALNCDSLEPDNVYSTAMDIVDLAPQISHCLSNFSVDISQFTSANAINDFEQVRRALGHEKINVYGGSYGTRAALVYMKMFPDSLSSVVLDSVGPLEVPLGIAGKSSARSFEMLLNDCQQDEACHQAFPKLASEFDEVVKRIETTPVEQDIYHPRLGTQTKLIIDKQKFVSNVRFQLYSVEGRTMMPLVIHQAYLGNYLPLAGLISQTDGGIGVNMSLFVNISCSESYPFVSVEKLANDAENSFGKDASHYVFENVCPSWPKYQVADNYHEPVTANIPTLILSGDLDPVTPPSNGEYPNQSLPNSKHLIAKNVSHIVAGKGCSSKLIAEFIEHKDPQAVDGSCLDDIPAQAFMTSLNGIN